MRAGQDPNAVFDALRSRGQIEVHASEVERQDALAEQIAGAPPAGATVVVDTREHAAPLNAAIRDRLVAAGVADDGRVAVTGDGATGGRRDPIVTRRNNDDLGVAYRETWTVTRVHRDGRLTVD